MATENQLYLQILPREQKKLWLFLAKQNILDSFYLAGGTALALQIGHRQSIDFDFFTNGDFENFIIIDRLRKYGDFELFTESLNTIHGKLNNVQVSFFKIKDKLIEKPINYEQIHLASKLDIALMKINAIGGRGSRKDFIDLYFLLKEYSLTTLFDQYCRKYGKGLANNYHLLKSLVYFTDAEKQPMPKMIKKVIWNEVKKQMVLEVKKDDICFWK